MKTKQLHLSLLLVSTLSILSCSCFSFAVDCDEPDYPDQYPYTCGGINPIIVDTENSVEEIGPNDNGTVSISGGDGKYLWQITGNGFYFDQAGTITTMQTTATTVVVYTINACGAGTIAVNNNCSRISYNVRSTSGVWAGPYEGCAAPIPLIEQGSGDEIVGNIRQISQAGIWFGNINCGGTFTGAGCFEDVDPGFCNPDCLASKPCGNAEDWIIMGSMDCLTNCDDGQNCTVQWGEADHNWSKYCNRWDFEANSGNVSCVAMGDVSCFGWNNSYYEWQCQ